MGLSKEYIQQALAQLEADIAQVPAPKDLEVLIPIFIYYGYPPVPNPIQAESGKVYLFEFLLADHRILMPTDPEPGFCFEVRGVELANQGPFRLELIAASGSLVVGDCTFGDVSGISETNKFAIDAPATAIEGVRLTFVGEVDYIAVAGVTFKLWKMERLDDVNSTTKLVHYATAAALPSYTNDGHNADRVLTAVAPGQLTVDGKTYTDTDRELILVKDEGDNTVNGLYRLVQVDPWKLRRAGIDQGEGQVNVRGALYQVMFGTANGGKQFFRDHYTSNVNPVTGGGGGYATIQNEGAPLAQETVVDFQGAGVTAVAGPGKTVVTVPGFTDVLVDSTSSPYAASVQECITCKSVAANNLLINLPAVSAALLGKEIIIKGWSDTTFYQVQAVPNGGDTIDGGGTYTLATNYEAVRLRVVKISTGPDVYEWAQVG